MAHISNAIIHGSTFNSAQGDLHINDGGSESGLHTLRLGVSLGAIHDSADRYPPPNCHLDTRKAVRQIISDWIHNESSASSFFWLYGPAGAGKTAILQAIAEFLCSPSGSGQNFGGSFFFSRGKNGRDQGDPLFSTIAYQLALNVPGLRQHVNRIMELNPTLHTKSMHVQLQTLIVDAFQSLSPLPQRSYLVIIDGLDECHDKAAQQSILRLLCETITVHELPLRYLIGSRPESHICNSFGQESLYKVTRRVVLDETFDPGRDIQVFLQDGFAKFCVNNSILSHVEQPWPGEGIIDLLVQRSSGQFVYATTVLKFVGADLCSPTKQLALILRRDPTAFSDLDQLYTQILSVYLDPGTVDIVQVLGIILAFDDDDLTPEVIEDILRMEEGELKVGLRGLSSLIAFKGDKNGEYLSGKVVSHVKRPYFLHASFGDFLLDSNRSGPFHVDKQKYKEQTTRWCFSLISNSIASSWRITPPTRFRLSETWEPRQSETWELRHGETWDYFELHLAEYFICSTQVTKEAIITDLYDLVEDLWKSCAVVQDAPFTAIHHLREILDMCFRHYFDDYFYDICRLQGSFM